jgi:hypothetical protein
MFEFDNGINKITGWQKICQKKARVQDTNIPGAVFGPLEA